MPSELAARRSFNLSGRRPRRIQTQLSESQETKGLFVTSFSRLPSGVAMIRVNSIGLITLTFFLFVAVGRSDDQADAKPILDRASRALGGEETLTRMKSGAARGKFTIRQGGQIMLTATLDASWNGPDKH